jgi:hypothetical protein
LRTVDYQQARMRASVLGRLLEHCEIPRDGDQRHSSRRPEQVVPDAAYRRNEALVQYGVRELGKVKVGEDRCKNERSDPGGQTLS